MSKPLPFTINSEKQRLYTTFLILFKITRKYIKHQYSKFTATTPPVCFGSTSALVCGQVQRKVTSFQNHSSCQQFPDAVGAGHSQTCIISSNHGTRIRVIEQNRLGAESASFMRAQCKPSVVDQGVEPPYHQARRKDVQFRC